MYLFNLFANIFKKKNFGVLIWLIINTVIVSFCFTVLIDIITEGRLDDWLEYVLGFVAYIGTMVIALSPVGEAILRWQNRCKKITDEEILSRLGKLFDEVREKSIEFDKSLNRNIKFYMSDDEAPNAFATGRKTVCITKGLLALTDDEIKGVLAHEFGHLSHKDTDVILVIAVGNMFIALAVSVISLIVRIFNWIVGFIFGTLASSERGGFIIGFLTSKFNALVSLLFGAVLWLWTKLGVMICMSSSRQNEFHADKFAFDIGFGAELKSALTTLEGGEKIKSKGLWAALNASHPDTDKRIEKLDSYSIAPVEPETDDSDARVLVDSGAYEADNKSDENLETETLEVAETENESTALKPENNDRLAMLRGFSSRFESSPIVKEKNIVSEDVLTAENTVNIAVEEEIVGEAKEEEITEPVKVETKSSELTMKFHKVNIYFLIPVAIIFAIVDLVTRGINISTYGFDAINAVGVTVSFATALFSVSALYDFKKRNSSAFVETMIARIASLISCCIVCAETFDVYSMYGLDDSIAIIISAISIIFSAVFTFIVYVYYKKRKGILFDNVENN